MPRSQTKVDRWIISDPTRTEQSLFASFFRFPHDPKQIALAFSAFSWRQREAHYNVSAMLFKRRVWMTLWSSGRQLAYSCVSSAYKWVLINFTPVACLADARQLAVCGTQSRLATTKEWSYRSGGSVGTAWSSRVMSRWSVWCVGEWMFSDRPYVVSISQCSLPAPLSVVTSMWILKGRGPTYARMV